MYSFLFLLCIFLYVRMGDEQATVLHLGFICSFASMIMIGSPLVTLVSPCPFSLSCASLNPGTRPWFFFLFLFFSFNFHSSFFLQAEVIQTKDTSSMSFPLSCMNLIVSTLWAIFGLRVADNFIFVPNIAGAALSCVQLTLFFLYGFPKPPSHKEEDYEIQMV